MWRALLPLVVAACASRAAPPAGAPRVIDGRATNISAEQAAGEDPAQVLRALVAAVSADDGAGFDALVHPVHGAWLWTNPSGRFFPKVALKRGDTRPPSQRIPGGLTLIRFGLEGVDRIDVDPSDPDAAIYGNCSEEEPGYRIHLRAWLRVGEPLGYHADALEDAGVSLDPVLTEGLAHYHFWGLDVFLAHDRGRWWVAHLMPRTMCDR